MSLIVNISRSIWSKKGCDMTKPEDFMPEWYKEDVEVGKQSIEDQKQVLTWINRIFGKKDNDG